MPGQPTPPLIQEAFAKNAAAPYITTPIPLTTVDPARASFELGFPPQTMLEILAGGTPPFGQDVNGILYMVTSHIAALQAGQPYLYNSTLSTAMGGYANGVVLGMSDGSGLWINTSAGNTTDPDSGGTANWMPLYSHGFTAVTGLIGGVTTLTPSQYRRDVIVLSGTLVSNLQVVLPAGTIGQRTWLIVNTTSGAFTTVVKTAAGTGVTVPQGGFAAPTEVYGDGTSIYPTVSPVNLPIDQNPTPSTIPVRTNTADLYARYFVMSVGPEIDIVSAVCVEFGSNGFIRKMTPTQLAAQIAIAALAGQVSDAQVPQSAVTQHTAAVLANAALTGSPTAPTPAVGNNSAAVATTAFVQANQMKVACGRVIAGVLQAGSIGVTGITPTGTGAFDIDVTAAGFSQIPAPVGNITIIGSNPDTCVTSAVSSILVHARTVFGGTPVARDFNFIIVGL